MSNRPLKNICLHLTKKVMTENKELGTIHIKIKVVAFSLTVTENIYKRLFMEGKVYKKKVIGEILVFCTECLYSK